MKKLDAKTILNRINESIKLNEEIELYYTVEKMNNAVYLRCYSGDVQEATELIDKALRDYAVNPFDVIYPKPGDPTFKLIFGDEGQLKENLPALFSGLKYVGGVKLIADR